MGRINAIDCHACEQKTTYLARSKGGVAREDYLAVGARINERSIKYLFRKADEDAEAERLSGLRQAQTDLDEGCVKDPELCMLCERLDYGPEDLLGMDFDTQMMLSEDRRHVLVH